MTSHRSSQALVIVEHENHHSLYLSDETGIYFTLSLKDIVVKVNDIELGYFTIDLEIVSSCVFMHI